jgi:hypothetical protein
MVTPVSDRATAEVATYLMALYGDGAGTEATARANASRDRGNVQLFCRWRQVARLVSQLSEQGVSGTVH